MNSLTFPIANVLLAVLPTTRLFAAKRTILRLIGIDVGPNACICGGVTFYGSGAVTIGANSWIGIGVMIISSAGSRVIIGNNCDIAPGVLLHTGSHMIGGADRRAGTGYSKPIVVGDGCWIGARSTLLCGSTIGNSSIVAAGSVVTMGEYPASSLIAGVPAGFKRKL